jgi:hypothetical protein
MEVGGSLDRFGSDFALKIRFDHVLFDERFLLIRGGLSRIFMPGLIAVVGKAGGLAIRILLLPLSKLPPAPTAATATTPATPTPTAFSRTLLLVVALLISPADVSIDDVNGFRRLGARFGLHRWRWRQITWHAGFGHTAVLIAILILILISILIAVLALSIVAVLISSAVLIPTAILIASTTLIPTAILIASAVLIASAILVSPTAAALVPIRLDAQGRGFVTPASIVTHFLGLVLIWFGIFLAFVIVAAFLFLLVVVAVFGPLEMLIGRFFVLIVAAGLLPLRLGTPAAPPVVATAPPALGGWLRLGAELCRVRRLRRHAELFDENQTVAGIE